jgi:hypothetical protein
VVRQFSFTHASTILLMYLSSVICHLTSAILDR